MYYLKYYNPNVNKTRYLETVGHSYEYNVEPIGGVEDSAVIQWVEKTSQERGLAPMALFRDANLTNCIKVWTPPSDDSKDLNLEGS